MSIAKEFRDFINRGSVVDLAVGVVIGAAFGKIVASFVGDVLMPPIGLLLGGIDFSNIGITLKQAVGGDPKTAVVLRIGTFINQIIDFAIVAFAIFMVVKGFNYLRRKEAEKPPAAPPGPTEDQKLLGEIRDILKAK
ncbi:MAG TPA: large-conductance mechanosensitive channel protein MscL [Thermoanaerobaculia bacterium]|nr:large-conductance mechanosensitive channel protein MscL [Thermoanaerobaculia bacterium]